MGRIGLLLLLLWVTFGQTAALSPQRPFQIADAPLTLTTVSSTNRYIVELAGRPLAVQPPATIAQVTANLTAVQTRFLEQAATQLNRPLDPLFQYQTAFNGLALQLTAAETAVLAQHPHVVRITPDQTYELLTDTGPGLIQAPAVWSGIGDLQTRGEGIIIGIIDTGINAEHPAFADIGEDGFNHTNPFGPGNYKGACVQTPSLCNDKLVGAWDFADGFGEADGPLDSDGHGSHTASTAAGNHITVSLETPTGYTADFDISGVAPHANLISYDACTLGCPGAALLAAIDQAVADGVDIINYSISGGVDPYADPVALAFLNAVEAGVFVAAAGGNSGPMPGTVNHATPWVTTVAASTHGRLFTTTLSQLTSSGGPLTDLNGRSLTSPSPTAPIVLAAHYGDAGCLAAFPPGTFTGQIVACERGQIARTQKGENVLIGGAGGLILMNTVADGDDLHSDAHFLPAIHISYADAVRLKAWLAQGTGHRGKIGGTQQTAVSADLIAPFSARGSVTAVDLLKPDLTAPGVSILAALHDGETDAGLLSGTSMAAPHVAGAAALLRALHPDWTPDQIRSALMMSSVTADVRKENEVTLADPFDRGAGRINVALAAQVALTMQESRTNYEAASPFASGDPRTLNRPSLADSNCLTTCSWTRTVTSTDDVARTWTVTAVSDAPVQFDITPNSFSLAPGASQVVTVTADLSAVPADGGWVFGQIDFQSGGAVPLHWPVAVRKGTASDPAVLQKTAVSLAQPNQRLDYTIQLNNLDNITRTFQLTDTLPSGVSYVPGSATGGLIYDLDTRQLTWQGTVGPGVQGYDVTAVQPLDYVNLGALSPPAIDLCTLFADCDEVVATFNLATNGYSFPFFGQPITSLHVSSNGLLLGPDGLSGLACLACPQPLPNAAQPNQLIAGLWRDIDMSAGNGQFYGGVLAGLLENPSDLVFYANWHNAAQYGHPFVIGQHAIAVVLAGQSEPAGRIYLIYNGVTNAPVIQSAGFAVGVEDGTGLLGEMMGYAPCRNNGCVPGTAVGTLPAAGTTWRLDPAIVAGPSGKTFTYQVDVTGEVGDLLSNGVVATVADTSDGYTAVADTLLTYRTYYPIVATSP